MKQLIGAIVIFTCIFLSSKCGNSKASSKNNLILPDSSVTIITCINDVNKNDIPNTVAMRYIIERIVPDSNDKTRNVYTVDSIYLIPLAYPVVDSLGKPVVDSNGRSKPNIRWEVIPDSAVLKDWNIKLPNEIVWAKKVSQITPDTTKKK